MLTWTTDPGRIQYAQRGGASVDTIRFRKITFQPDFVLCEDEDGIVRGRQSFRVVGIEFDRKG